MSRFSTSTLKSLRRRTLLFALLCLTLLFLSNTFYFYSKGRLISDAHVADISLVVAGENSLSKSPLLRGKRHRLRHSNSTVSFNVLRLTKRLRTRNALHKRIAPINPEFAEDFGVSLSKLELQRRIDSMHSQRWLTTLVPYTDMQTVASGRPLIAYKMNTGQLNNQLVALLAMVKYAIYYNRTLVIPLSKPRLATQYVAFEHGVWDLQRLSQIVDFIFEVQLPSHLQPTFQKYKYADSDVNETDECSFFRDIGTNIPEKAQENCEMIWISGGRILLIEWDSQWPWPSKLDVWKYLIPAPYIRNAVELWLMTAVFNGERQKGDGNDSANANSTVAVALVANDTKMQEKPKSKMERRNLRWRPLVAVHRRAMDEYRRKRDGLNETRDYVCRRPKKSIVTSARYYDLRKSIYNSVRTLVNASIPPMATLLPGIIEKERLRIYEHILWTYHYTCAMNLTDLNRILVLHKQDAIGSAMALPFFLGHDRQEPEVVDYMIANGRGILQSDAFHSKWSQVEAWKKFGKLKEFDEWKSACKIQPKLFCADFRFILGKEALLFDMWTMFYADFFVGTWMSTLTDTVCKWRGKALSMASSTHCFLEDKWQQTEAALPNDKSMIENTWFSWEAHFGL